MAESVRIETVTLADLRADPNPAGARWDDPHAMARMTEEKRRAMLSNPLRGPESGVAQLLAVKGDFGAGARGRVIGRLDLLRSEIVAGGARVAALWGSDWSVPEAERGSMAAISLLMQMQRLTPPPASGLGAGIVGASGPSVAATEVYQKLKWVDFPMRRMILVRRSRSMVERYVGTGWKGGAARVALDAGLAAHAAVVGAATGAMTRGCRARFADAFPPEWERLLPGDAPALAGGSRSAAFIDWWLRNSFFPPTGARARNANLLVLVERGSGAGATPVGYAVCKVRHYDFATHRRLPNLALGSIQDWAVFPGAPGAGGAALSWAGLFLLASRALIRVGADAVDLCVDDSHGEGARAARALRRVGFLPVGFTHLLWKPAKDSPLADPRFARADAWRLRPGDGDTFFT